jgi:basic membrane protein A
MPHPRRSPWPPWPPPPPCTPPRFAQARLKVAAIYTVPVEQQWVSRIDKALKAAVGRGEIEYVFSENVSNADYERVMRQYAEKPATR